MSATITEREIRVCKICAAEFTPHRQQAVTCGPVCSEEYRKVRRRAAAARVRARNRAVLQCVDCGAEFRRESRSRSERCLACRDQYAAEHQAHYTISAAQTDAARAEHGKPPSERMPAYFTMGDGGKFDLLVWLEREREKLERAGTPVFLTPEQIAERRAFRHSK